jgi:MFS family permease
MILAMAVPRTTAGRQAAAAGGRIVAGVWSELREGVAYLFGSRALRGILLCLSMVQFGVGAINVLWVPFLQRTYGMGPEGLGAVDMAQGIGMVLGGLVLGFVSARLAKRAIVGWGVVFCGAMIGLMGVAPAFSAASLLNGSAAQVPQASMAVGERLLHLPLMLLVYSVLLGVALVPAQSALMTLMQLAVPDLKRGRVGSAMNALAMAAGLLSMAAAAALGEVMRLGTIYVISGLILAASGLVGMLTLEEPKAQPALPAAERAEAVGS